MRTVIRKWFVDLEKEEQWLNEMGEKGLGLVDFRLGKYTFEPCEPGKYSYRIEQLANKPKREKKEYIEFLEGSSIELVTESFGWAFFRMEDNRKRFQLFSTNSSKIQHYQRIMIIFGLIAFVNFCIVSQGVHQGPYLFKSDGLVLSLPFLMNLPCGIFMIICANKYYQKIKQLKLMKSIME